MKQDRQETVRHFFENTAQYLKFDYNLRIRRETLDVFTENLSFDLVLDAPCGNGAISSVLLPRTKKLLMMDISQNMCRLAESSIPSQYRPKTEIVCENIFSYEFGTEKFDLVICFGLMAHVGSPKDLLLRLSQLVKPGGYLVLQNTDSSHFYNYFIRAYLAFRSLLKKLPYSLNNVSSAFVESELAAHGFSKTKEFRYNQSFLGFSNLFSNEKKYRLTRKYFGDAAHPKNQSKGSDVTYLFKMKV